MTRDLPPRTPRDIIEESCPPAKEVTQATAIGELFARRMQVHFANQTSPPILKRAMERLQGIAGNEVIQSVEHDPEKYRPTQSFIDVLRKWVNEEGPEYEADPPKEYDEKEVDAIVNTISAEQRIYLYMFCHEPHVIGMTNYINNETLGIDRTRVAVLRSLGLSEASTEPQR